MAHHDGHSNGEVQHRNVYVRLTVEEVDALRRMAKSEERTLSAQIRFLLKQDLQGKETAWSQ